ncbi:MAG TPA: ABC transporter ATP-binding protein, partial [Bacteroidales bacterium]|nr:ABC transporter ATP-binding protein [Bacteroidales bacterium]
TFSSKDKEIVMEALEMTHLINVQNKFTDQLSGGERQRVLIARAIAQNTPILLLDEPLSNLDITHQFEIMDILSQLNENQKITILIVVHNLSIINQYAKKILMLKNGKVFRYGELKNVFNPENIKNLFDLPERLSVDMSGNITKNSNF